MSKDEKNSFTERLVMHYAPIAVFIISFVLFVSLTVMCFFRCVDIIQFTIPAGAMEGDFTLIEYLQETGIIQHLTGMSQSAQGYFILDLIGMIAHAALAVITCVFGIIFTMNKVGSQTSERKNPNHS